MNLFDEIQIETWHILMSLYSYQRIQEIIIQPSQTRYEISSLIVAANEITEMIIIRVARLNDKNSKNRSIKKYLSSHKLSQDAINAGKDFIDSAEKIINIRHTKIAHMAPGTLSNYSANPLSQHTLIAVEKLINFIDIVERKEVNYTCTVGSQELPIDLRNSVQTGKTITVKPDTN